MSTITRSSPTPPRDRAALAPSLTVLAVVSAALLVAGLVVSTALAGETFPSPFVAAEVVRSYVTEHRDALRTTAFASLASAVPLAIYAATAAVRLRHLGIHQAGPVIALAGGLGAAGSLALSGMASWVLARPDVADEPAVVPAVHALAFVSGGPGHVVALGLLVAGMAVPGLIAGLLPRWLALVGLGLAAVAELSSLALLVDGAAYLLPVGRFGGLAWLITAAALLPTRRTRAAT